MYQKTLSVFLAVVAVLFIGTGITGFVTFGGEDVQCFKDSDCAPDVCCPLYGKNYGMCDVPAQCASIYVESKAEGTNYAPRQVGEAQTERNYIAIVLGIVLFLIIAIVSYVEYRQEKVHPGHHKRKSRR